MIVMWLIVNAILALSLIATAIWLSRQTKFNTKSRWSWWTPSGILSRFISIAATKWAESPNDLFPVAVFAYGIVELFGVRRGIKLLVRFHAIQTKKLRQRARVSSANISTGGNVSSGPHS